MFAQISQHKELFYMSNKKKKGIKWTWLEVTTDHALGAGFALEIGDGVQRQQIHQPFTAKMNL